MIHDLRDERRVLLVDPKCAQLEKLRGWSHLWPEYDTKQELWADDRVSRVMRTIRDVDFRIVIHFRHSHRQQLDLLCRMVRVVKNCVLAVDELGLFIPPGPAGALPENITSCVVSGTHEGIVLAGTAQRPSLVHATVRAQATRILFYRMTEQAEVDVSGRYLGDEFNVAALPDHVCVDWADGRASFQDGSYAGKLGNVLPGARSARR